MTTSNETHPTDLSSLARLIELGRKYALIVIVTTAAGIVVSLLYSFIAADTWRSEASILPSSSSRMGSLASLAGAAGLQLPALDMGEDFDSVVYPVILQSQTITEAVLESRYSYTVDGETATGDLYAYLGEESFDRAREGVLDIIQIRTDSRTGVIRVSATTRSPALSQQILDVVLGELDRFNRERRISRAQRTLEFVEERVEQVSVELDAAQDALESFQEQNRNFASTTDPELLRRHAELQLQTQLKTSAYTALAAQYETARIEAVRDLPVVTLLDEPRLPTRRHWPRLSLVLIGGCLMGFAIGLGFALVRETGLAITRAVQAD